MEAIQNQMSDFAEAYASFNMTPHACHNTKPCYKAFNTLTPSEAVNKIKSIAANQVGIVTGENSVDVLDIDKKDYGLNIWSIIISVFDLHTLTVKSGGGGCHYYFKHDTNLSKTGINNSSKLIQFNHNGKTIKFGIDIRTDGGYVVAPGSQHSSGNVYTFDDANADQVMTKERYEAIHTFPDWLKQVLQKDFLTKPIGQLVKTPRVA